MPEHCLSMRCIDCESHAIVGGKLDCNYMNRLGLAQSTVKTFLEDETDPTKVEARIKDAAEQQTKLTEEIEKLKRLKEQYGDKGEKKDAGLS